MSLSRTQQDYIKVIWNLDQVQKKAKIKIVADTLFVKSPTVLTMFRQLAKLGLISYNKREGAKLTIAGREEAEQLIRKHRLIETFFRSVLKIEDASGSKGYPIITKKVGGSPEQYPDYEDDYDEDDDF